MWSNQSVSQQQQQQSYLLPSKNVPVSESTSPDEYLNLMMESQLN